VHQSSIQQTQPSQRNAKAMLLYIFSPLYCFVELSLSNYELLLFKHLTLSFIRFHSQPQRLQPRRLLHFTFASTGHCPEPPWVGTRFTLHTTPHLCWCLTVCFHTRLWGLGLSTVVLCGFLWCPTPNFPMWFFVGRDSSASSSVTKIPATSTSRLRAPCPG
jgi:hypothetical protein